MTMPTITIAKEWLDGDLRYCWACYKDGTYIRSFGLEQKEQAEEWKQKLTAHYEAEESHQAQIIQGTK